MTDQETFPRSTQAGLLLDRQAETAALSDAVDRVLAGEGSVVLIEGGPGAGKTRLLAEARALAVEAGLDVLSAQGGEMEREYPFGVVRQLFEAALLDPGSASLLDGPAAPASTVFVPDGTVEAAPFATLNGLYWLTANVASGESLVMVIDDLHWVDRPSVGFLQFLIRRLEGMAVLLVIAGRPAETDAFVDLSASPASEVLRPAALSETSAAELAEELLGERPAERFAAACRRATGGNPLLLVELVRALRAERIAPDDAHVDAIDAVGPSALARIVLLRLRRLPGESLAVAQAIAVLGTGAEASLLAELAGVDEDAVARGIEALIESEIVDPQPPLRFVHPIVREAIYRDLAPDERDRRHLRAAELLLARAAKPDLAGAHLLLLEPRGERWIKDALQAAATDAVQRGAVESAITFLRRALAERPGDPDYNLLFGLAMTEAPIDPRSAIEHLRAARSVAADEKTRVRLGEIIARLLVFYDPGEALTSARQTRAELPDDAYDMRAGLVALEQWAGRFSSRVVAEPYPDEVPDTPRGRMLRAVQAWDLALSGGTATECAALAAEVLGLEAQRPASATQDPTFTAMIASSVLILADDPRAQTFWDGWYAEALRVGRAHAVIAGGVWNGLMHFRLSRLPEAEAAMRAAIEGPRAWGPGTETVPAHTLACLADVLVERGDLAGARAALDLIPDHLDGENEGALQGVNAELRLLAAQGRHQAVLDTAEPAIDQLRTVLNPCWAPWRSLRAEALSRLGRLDEAVDEVSEELELARRWGTPGPIGRALTLLGALEGRVDLLEEAVAITIDPFARLEHAKALLALGRAVRQDGRPSEARAHLRDAHDMAARCGADGLARQARDELGAAGGRPRAVAGSGVDALTASERRVAEIAAAGRSNREIAQELYLSPKTVEVHLSSSYRKLGIRTRGELTSALGAEA